MVVKQRIANVGFLGIGRIGQPICKNLIESGYQVLGYRRGSVDEFTAAGGVALGSPAEVVAQSDIIFCCMPTDEALHQVICGPGGVVDAVRPGQIVVELGSHPITIKQRYVSALSENGAIFLDGEVSGTPGMVAQRKAAIYLAGDRGAAEIAASVVRGFADLCFYLGAFGSASNVKLINNFLVALHIAGAAQAMAIGLRTGVDPALLIKAISMGSGGSTQFGIRAPMMADRRFNEQNGPADGLVHYCEGARELAASVGVTTPLLDSVLDTFRAALPIIGDRDVAAILESFEPSA
jgi:3-hydroxyisobutyrate dehydrogenase-like beta-hydroxyacid dehydrogenase